MLLNTLAAGAAGVVAAGATYVVMTGGTPPEPVRDVTPAAATVATADDASCALPEGVRERVEERLAALPDGLREDLEALPDLDRDERHDAAREIWEGALAGEYGDEAQAIAEEKRDRFAGRAGGPGSAVAELLPDELRTDLEAVRELDADERRAALEALREEVLAGGYGEDAQAFAEKREELRGERSGPGPLGGRLEGRLGAQLGERVPEELRERIAARREACSTA